ncbi:hypothetical protein [Actibacterium sp.]|uniref:hypothetical protein n=1 Tax=Actibacterium sp. TaxID=1872125 RepID=UPI0025796220|nr:hypothetical protein [Actibacterium sp.]|tara:strand:- start:654 stop:872 length:219 start_codon:yes stop_codon:yes gene_type:complete
MASERKTETNFESRIRRLARESAREVPRPFDAPPKLTLDPNKADRFFDPKTGKRHDRNSDWGTKCRKTFSNC